MWHFIRYTLLVWVGHPFVFGTAPLSSWRRCWKILGVFANTEMTASADLWAGGHDLPHPKGSLLDWSLVSTVKPLWCSRTQFKMIWNSHQNGKIGHKNIIDSLDEVLFLHLVNLLDLYHFYTTFFFSNWTNQRSLLFLWWIFIHFLTENHF